eukprot:1109823-Rhodomonas_salina.3
MRQIFRSASYPEVPLPPVPPKTRGEVLDWAWDRHSNVVEKLKGVEALIMEAGKDPADFRLLLAFDSDNQVTTRAQHRGRCGTLKARLERTPE